MTVTPLRQDRPIRPVRQVSGPGRALARPRDLLDEPHHERFGWVRDAIRHLHQMTGPAWQASILPRACRTEWARQLADDERRIATDALDGPGWIRVARMATDPASPILLPPSTGREWADRLVAEAVVATGGTYITRAYALALLLDDPYLGKATQDALDAVVPVARGRRASQATVLATTCETTEPHTQQAGDTPTCPVWHGLDLLAGQPGRTTPSEKPAVLRLTRR